MAKRTDETVDGATDVGSEPPSGRSAEDTIGDFAADLGRILGSAQAKASAWMDQRKAITDQLTQIRDTASQYLQQLTGGGADMAVAVARGRRGRPTGTAKRGPGRPKGSGAARAAKNAKGAKRAGKRKGSMSPEGRARVSAAQKARWAAKRKAEGE